MTGPTLDHSAQDPKRTLDRPLRRARATWRLALCAAVFGFLLACGGGAGGGSDSGGGGGGGGGGDPEPSTEPVDLPPGQTVAHLSWRPSEGFVTGYMVFVSRNHGGFDINGIVPSPTVAIDGVPGDEIRITVVAVSEDGHLSPASPPSAEIRFHAAIAPTVATVAPPPIVSTGGAPGGDASGAGGDPTPTTASNGDAGADSGSDSGTNGGATAGGDPSGEDPNADPGDSLSDPGTVAARLSVAAREALLLADARLPIASLGAAAASWLEAQVESEVTAGVALVGTALRASDGLRDLVWQDAPGELPVSEAAAPREALEPGATLVAAIRLRATERFVGLADLDGDGLRDWILEDVLTGEAWLRSDDASLDRSARAAHQPLAARLLGAGDFDGDGQAELLWQNEDRSLAVERPDGSAVPGLIYGVLPPDGHGLVAFADLTGDGRDDLIARGEDGRLALGLVQINGESGALGLEWSVGHAAGDAAHELVATLDLDRDGRAELAWLVGDQIEVRGVGETAPQAFEF